MDHFLRHDGVLYAENVALDDIARRFGTPCYVYSKATLVRHVNALQVGLRGLDHLLCYAVKANGNLALLQVLHEAGCGFDAVSGGELARVRKVGVPMQQVIVSGVGKTAAEIDAALAAGVLYIGVESHEELATVAQVAAQRGMQAPVSIRVNPDVDANTHPHISTGLKENKFGVPIHGAFDLYLWGQAQPSLQMVGVTSHIGSQITTLAPFTDAARRLAALCKRLQSHAVPIKHIGVGGGLGVTYHTESPPEPAAYGAALADILGPLNLRVVLEPGRVIVGNAGVLLTRVVRRKQGADRNFVLVDAGMNDLLRPALYDAYHEIETVAPPSTVRSPIDVVGPVCESADTFAKARNLPALQQNDLLVLRTAGAYGFVMASTYNGRPRPAEVLCDGATATLIRARETVEDLWRGEYWRNGQPVNGGIDAKVTSC